jgi:hypothetical protein
MNMTNASVLRLAREERWKIPSDAVPAKGASRTPAKDASQEPGSHDHDSSELPRETSTTPQDAASETKIPPDSHQRTDGTRDGNEPVSSPTVPDGNLYHQPTPLGPISYFKRHWRGECSLAEAFWLNTVLVNFLFSLTAKGMGSFDFQISIVTASGFVVSSWLFAIIVTTWQSVGLWRSATRSKSYAMAVLSKFFVLIITFSGAYTFLRIGFPQISESVGIVTGDDEIPDFKIVLLPNGREIEFSGGIKLGAATKLKSILEIAPYVEVIQLDTIGGRIGEAVKMAELVAARNLDTYVPSYCASAGVLVFLAGKERSIRRDAKIGFHSPSFAGESSADATTVFADRLVKKGVDAQFVRQAVNSTEMWYPSSKQLVSAGVVTKLTQGGENSLSSVELNETTLTEFRDSILSVPLYNALHRLVPDRVELLLLQTHRRVQAGVGMLDAATELNRLLAATVSSRWGRANEAALDLYLDYKIKLIEDNYKENPRNVLLRLNDVRASEWSVAELDSNLPRYPKEMAYRLYEEVLKSTGSDAPEALRKFGELLFKRMIDQEIPADGLQLIGQLPLPPDPNDYRKACEVQLLLYKKVKAHPERHNIARFLVAP